MFESVACSMTISMSLFHRIKTSRNSFELNITGRQKSHTQNVTKPLLYVKVQFLINELGIFIIVINFLMHFV